MNNNTSKIIIETIVRKALKEIQDSPKRNIRNLVDLALHFSTGRFQEHFFKVAQNMLKTESSSYYDLIQDAVNNISANQLITLGMNIGYNSCTTGAAHIRSIESKENYNIPWTIKLNIDSNSYFNNFNKLSEVVEEGESLGIYTWHIMCKDSPEYLLPFISNYPDSAFILFVQTSDLSPSFIDDIDGLNNLMLVIEYEENAEVLYKELRNRKIAYSLSFTYSEDDYCSISNGDLFISLQQYHPLFTVLIANKCCSKQIKQKVYDEICNLREQQILCTVPWELSEDTLYIDSVISNEPCSIEFDIDGNLCIPKGNTLSRNLNIYSNTLKFILHRSLVTTKK